MKLLKITIRILCVFLAVGIVLTAVFFRGNNVKTIAFNSKISIPEAVSLEPGILKKVGKSGFIELYFNETTSEVAVKELSSGYLWQSGEKVAELTVADENGIHQLNSRDNSIAFLSWKYEIKQDALGLEFTVSKENKSVYTQNDLVFKVLVDIVIKDGSIFLESSIENLSENDECSVIAFDIMPDFCSFSNPEKSDFIVIPDGCGSVIYPALCDKAEVFETKVYGNDYSTDLSSQSDAIMGAFGIGYKESAVAVIVDKGEELATIKAEACKNDLSKVYASFTPDGFMIDGDKAYVHSSGDKCQVALCYKFLSGENASYSEIASSCREQFIRNGTLPSTDVQKAEATELFLTLTGVYKSSPRSFISVDYTTFSQAQDILSRIKAKGVDSISVRYTGVYRGDSLDFYGASGSKGDFEDLCEYATNQNISLYMDTNISSYPSFLAKADISAVRRPDKSTAFSVVNEAPDSVAENYSKLRFRRTEDIGDFVEDMIKSARNSTYSGYCIGDGENLVSDYSHEFASRTDTKETIASQLPAISTVCKAIVDKGNMYLLKNSSGVINIPMKTYYPETVYYQAIPFIQSVLHGRVIMAGTPINTDIDIKKATLQCIEYGVCPSFTAVYSGKNLSNNVRFDNIINDIIDSYALISDALQGLESERITDHICLADGVYLTTYGDTAQIYVNYNQNPVTVKGVEVGAMSALRID